MKKIPALLDLGAPAGLDFTFYEKQISTSRRAIAAEANRVKSALAKLMGQSVSSGCA